MKSVARTAHHSPDVYSTKAPRNARWGVSPNNNLDRTCVLGRVYRQCSRGQRRWDSSQTGQIYLARCIVVNFSHIWSCPVTEQLCCKSCLHYTLRFIILLCNKWHIAYGWRLVDMFLCWAQQSTSHIEALCQKQEVYLHKEQTYFEGDMQEKKRSVWAWHQRWSYLLLVTSLQRHFVCQCYHHNSVQLVAVTGFSVML